MLEELRLDDVFCKRHSRLHVAMVMSIVMLDQENKNVPSKGGAALVLPQPAEFEPAVSLFRGIERRLLGAVVHGWRTSGGFPGLEGCGKARLYAGFLGTADGLLEHALVLGGLHLVSTLSLSAQRHVRQRLPIDTNCY